MTISNSTTPTKESILDKWNTNSNWDRNEIEERIIELLEVQYFQESYKIIEPNCETANFILSYEGANKPLTGKDKKELNLYRKIFEWDESYKVCSTWYADYRADIEEKKDSVAEVRNVIENCYSDGGQVKEPSSSDWEYWEVSHLSRFHPKVEIDNLRIKPEPKKPKSKKPESKKPEPRFEILPRDVWGLISTARIRFYKGNPHGLANDWFQSGDESTSGLPPSFVNTVQLVLRDHGIPNDFMGLMPIHVKEKIWILILDCLMTQKNTPE
tara:strand:+ start:1054 stop:1863 length:810 start_codon:yes stop_codon:yes gene_type:complete